MVLGQLDIQEEIRTFPSTNHKNKFYVDKDISVKGKAVILALRTPVF